jgi:hypothetical protein
MSPFASVPPRVHLSNSRIVRTAIAAILLLTIACNLTAIGKAVETGDTFEEVVEQINEEGKRMEKEYPPGSNMPAGVQAAPLEPTIPPLPSPRPATPPALTGVSFPGELPGDGTPKGGWFTFTDMGGDVTRAVFSVVSATNFTGFEFDPRETLTAGDYYGGTSEFNIWCEGSQTVTLRVTLFDQAGAGSNSLEFTFTCTE